MKYDAFISYSHFQDKELSIAIQKCLGKIAKPWYKLRNLNVFRDEDSLSASPKLWKNIEEALNQSRFFIYIASKSSAQSVWVVKEIEWWVTNKNIESILIVHGDNEEDLDIPLPEILKKYFKDNPFYTDLRKTKVNGEYSLKNPSFVEELIKLAAHIHNKAPKDLLSEDLKTHKKTLLVRNGSFVLLFLFLTLLVFFIFNSYELQSKKLEAFSSDLISQARLMPSNKALSIYFHNYLSNPNETNYTLLNTFYKGNSEIHERDILASDIKSEFREYNYFEREGDDGYGRVVNVKLCDGSYKEITLFIEEGAHSFYFDKVNEKEYYYGPSNYAGGIADFVLLEINYITKQVYLITDKIPFFDFSPTLLVNNGYYYVYCEWLPLGGDHNYLFYRYSGIDQQLEFYEPEGGINTIPYVFNPSPDNKYLYIESRHSGNNGIMDRSLFNMNSNKLKVLDVNSNFGFQFNNRHIFGAWFPMQTLREDYYSSLDYLNVMKDEDYSYPDGNNYFLLPMGNSLWLMEMEGEKTEPLYFFTTHNVIGDIEDINYRVNGFDVLSEGRVFSWDYYEGDDYLDEDHYYDYRNTIPNTFKAMESFHRFNDLSSSNEDIVISNENIEEINEVYAEEYIYGGTKGQFISVSECKIIIDYYDNYFSFDLCKSDLPKELVELKSFFNQNGYDCLTEEEKIELDILD